MLLLVRQSHWPPSHPPSGAFGEMWVEEKEMSVTQMIQDGCLALLNPPL